MKPRSRRFSRSASQRRLLDNPRTMAGIETLHALREAVRKMETLMPKPRSRQAFRRTKTPTSEGPSTATGTPGTCASCLGSRSGGADVAHLLSVATATAKRRATRAYPTERLCHRCGSAVEPPPQSSDHLANEPTFRAGNHQTLSIRGLHERPASNAIIQVHVGTDRTTKPRRTHSKQRSARQQPRQVPSERIVRVLRIKSCRIERQPAKVRCPASGRPRAILMPLCARVWSGSMRAWSQAARGAETETPARSPGRCS
ncbi:hypothetical protein RFUL19S_00301 [Rhizobacter fulvus]